MFVVINLCCCFDGSEVSVGDSFDDSDIFPVDAHDEHFSFFVGVVALREVSHIHVPVRFG